MSAGPAVVCTDCNFHASSAADAVRHYEAGECRNHWTVHNHPFTCCQD